MCLGVMSIHSTEQFYLFETRYVFMINKLSKEKLTFKEYVTYHYAQDLKRFLKKNENGNYLTKFCSCGDKEFQYSVARTRSVDKNMFVICLGLDAVLQAAVHSYDFENFYKYLNDVSGLNFRFEIHGSNQNYPTLFWYEYWKNKPEKAKVIFHAQIKEGISYLLPQWEKVYSKKYGTKCAGKVIMNLLKDSDLYWGFNHTDNAFSKMIDNAFNNRIKAALSGRSFLSNFNPLELTDF